METAVFEQYLILKVNDGDLFAIQDSSLEQEGNPSITLSQLFISGSSIINQHLQTLPIKMDEVADFHVQHDRIFILRNFKSIQHHPFDIVDRLELKCYDLVDGKMIKEFVPQVEKYRTTSIRPELILTVPERIQALYSSVIKESGNKNRRHFFRELGNTLMRLDYKV